MTDLGFPDSSVGKEFTCNAGDLGSIPGLGRSPGEGKGYPLQYSGLENSKDCIVHGVSKSRKDWVTLTFTAWFSARSLGVGRKEPALLASSSLNWAPWGSCFWKQWDLSTGPKTRWREEELERTESPAGPQMDTRLPPWWNQCQPSWGWGGCVSGDSVRPLPMYCNTPYTYLLAQMVKNLPAMQETKVWSLGREDPLEKGVATHSSILAWRIPWQRPRELQSVGSQSLTWLSILYKHQNKAHQSSALCSFPFSRRCAPIKTFQIHSTLPPLWGPLQKPLPHICTQ